MPDLHATRRRRYIAQMAIPMYDNFSKVYFYDVLQQMTLQVVMLAYNAERIRQNKAELKVLNFWKGGTANDTLAAMTAGQFQKDYDVDFHTMSAGIAGGEMERKIDLMNQLKKEVKKRQSA